MNSKAIIDKVKIDVIMENFSQGLQQRECIAKMTAEVTMTKFKALKAAGFTEDQAILLCQMDG